MNATQELFDAVRTGETAKVQSLIEADRSLVNARNEQGLAPLIMATYFGRNEIAEWLIVRGAELDIFAAAARGDTQRIETLLREAPELVSTYSADGWTALHLAAHFGQAEAARALLAHGADPHARSENGMANMPLHSAMAGQHADLGELLLANGAEVDARQHGGFTPLHSAAQNGDLHGIRLLLGHGADPSATSDDGKTPLALAEEAGHPEVKELLR